MEILKNFGSLFILAGIASRLGLWFYREKFTRIQAAYFSFLTAGIILTPLLIFALSYSYAFGLFVPALVIWLIIDLIFVGWRKEG